MTIKNEERRNRFEALCYGSNVLTSESFPTPLDALLDNCCNLL